MKKIVITIIGIILCGECIGQNSSLTALNSYYDKVDENALGIGAIMICKDSQPLYYRTFGQSQDMSDCKLYRIGSITKLFTATLVNYYVEKGKLGFNDKLDKFYPDVPNAENITIDHLLNHRSGLKDFVVKNDSLLYWLYDCVKEDEIMAEIVRQGTIFEAGTKQRYSNSGYYLLRRILEQITSETYPCLVERIITKPLGLESTISGSDDSSMIAKPLTINTFGEWESTRDFYFPNVLGVGDIVSTPNDLTKFIVALYAGNIIDNESVVKMLPASKERFGRGLMRYKIAGKDFYGHGGDTFVMHSVVIYNPSDNLAVALCINGQSLNINTMLSDVIKLYYDDGYEYSLPSSSDNDCNITVERLGEYTGLYVSDSLPFKIEIFLEGRNLMARATSQPAFILESMCDDKFRNVASGIAIEFDTLQNTLNLHQKGKVFSMNLER